MTARVTRCLHPKPQAALSLLIRRCGSEDSLAGSVEGNCRANMRHSNFVVSNIAQGARRIRNRYANSSPVLLAQVGKGDKQGPATQIPQQSFSKREAICCPHHCHR